MDGLLAHHHRMFAWDDWANREALASLRACGPGKAPAKSVRWLAHVAAAERLWWARVARDEEPVPVWPEWDLGECAERIEDVSRRWAVRLAALTPEGLLAPVAYPWYLIWPLCFVPLLRGQAGWTAITWAGTIGLSYAMWHQPTWRMSGTGLMLEYGMVYAVLIIEIVIVLRRARSALLASTTTTSTTRGDDATSDSRSSRYDPSPLRGSSA